MIIINSVEIYKEAINTFCLPYLFANFCESIMPIKPANIPPPLNTPRLSEVSFSNVGRNFLKGSKNAVSPAFST